MSKDHKFILSFPRSGNTLTRFIVEYLTCRPTQGCIGNPTGDRPLCESKFTGDKNPLEHVKGSCLFKKSHGLYDFAGNEPTTIIFIIRNFKEVIVRHCSGTNPDKNTFNIEYYQAQIKQYMELIRIYNNSKCPKICIYYEDLLEKPLDVITTLHQFIGEDSNQEKYQELLDNYDKLKNIVAFQTIRSAQDKIKDSKGVNVNSDFKKSFYFSKLNFENQNTFYNLFYSIVKKYSEEEINYIDRYL